MKFIILFVIIIYDGFTSVNSASNCCYISSHINFKPRYAHIQQTSLFGSWVHI